MAGSSKPDSNRSQSAGSVHRPTSGSAAKRKYTSKAPRNEARVVNLEQAGDLGIRRSLPAAKLPAAALAYLDPRPRVSYFFEPLLPEAGAEDAAA